MEARLHAIHPHARHLTRAARFYGVGAINTVWGYGTYAGLVALGLNLFVAQIGSQLLGVAFNYFSYTLGVFGAPPRSKAAYLAAYVVNYLAGLGFLLVFHSLGLSPYLAGLAALVCASLLNLLVLSRFVFRVK